VTITGIVGRPGAIGGEALPRTPPPKGPSLVDEVKRKPVAKRANADSTRAASPDQIALRVYGQGGIIGGGTGGDTAGGIGGRPASAYEVAMNDKVVVNWNENLWKVLPNRLSCTIQFLIDANGRVTNLQVFESSGNDGFDEASKRAIELALMPAPSAFGIPGNLHEARVTFVNRPD
jgi:TonB family protein